MVLDWCVVVWWVVWWVFVVEYCCFGMDVVVVFVCVVVGDDGGWLVFVFVEDFDLYC